MAIIISSILIMNIMDKMVQNIEVWVSRIGAVSTKERKVIAFMNPDTLFKYQNHRPALSVNYSGNGNGEMEAGPFVPLVNGSDYTYNPYLGLIDLKTSLQTNQAIAVAYNAGSEYGSDRQFRLSNTK